MADTIESCTLARSNGEILSPACMALLSGEDSGEGGIDALGKGYNFNREKMAAMLRSPLMALLPGGGLANLLAQHLQGQWQDEMTNTANATNASSEPAMPSSNASRQSDMLSSAGESWGAPTVGSGGGNVSRGFSTGGW